MDFSGAGRHLLWLLPSVLLLTPPAAAAAQPGTPGDWNIGFERQNWSREAPSQFATVRTRRAAALLALIPASLLFVLYLYQPTPALLAWVGGWTMTSVMTYLGAEASDLLRSTAGRGPPNMPGMALLAISQTSGVASAVLIWLGTVWFLATPRLQGAGVGVIAVTFAVLGSAAVRGEVSAVLVIGYSLTAAGAAAAVCAAAFLFRRTRLAGALFIAAGLAAVAATDFSAAALAWNGTAGVEMPNRLIFANAAWGTVVGLGMFLLAFEGMALELRETNEELARAERELEALAVTDPLTGCYNRRFFDEVVSRELLQHRRFTLPLSLLFVDCDRFKAINDRLGHETGDRVLQAVAGLLRSEIRASDYVFRWGGDEFVVLMSCDEVHAETKARAIREAFHRLPIARDLPEGSGLTVGWIAVPDGVRDVLPFVHAADQRMYANKRESA